jgi:hypothetical protein
MARFLCVIFLGSLVSGCGLVTEQLSVIPLPTYCGDTGKHCSTSLASQTQPATLR